MVDKKTALVEIVGREEIFDDQEVIDTYSRDCSFTPPRRPQLVVKPDNAEVVHRIVRWAKDTHTPVVPVSSGPPHFNGDTIPGVDGAIILDLSRMKRIMRIDRRTRMMVIEPGITYGELQPELARHGLRLSTPLLPRANKSVIASLLERQPTTVPKYQWTLPEPLRCLGVIFGNGYDIRTGEAGESVRRTLEEQWEAGMAQMQAIGPRQVDYHRLVSAAQGSMGIVTWASIKCEILPKLHKFILIPGKNLEDLIDCAYELLRVRLGDEFFIVNNMELATIIGEEADQIKVLSANLPPFVLQIGIAGRDMLPEERLAFQETDIREIAQKSGLEAVLEVSGVSNIALMDAVLNTSGEPYWKLKHKGAGQDIFFLTTLNKTPEFIKIMYRVAEEFQYPASDIGMYIQPQQQGVSCHCEFNIPYNPDDESEVVKVRDLTTRASEVLIKHGAFFSRPYGIWADMVYERDTTTKTVLKKMKEIFDPNNVLNPGKLCF